MELEFRNIVKSYGKNEILHGLNFKVESGRPMGFLGRNGAGKTTTIRALMGVFKLNSGEILLDGKKIDNKKLRIGYLPEERGMYGKQQILEQLIYFGTLRGGTRIESKKSASQLLERVGLEEYEKKNLDTLSKGNQQKVQIVQSLLNNPDILILDEPFSGLDPINSTMLKEMILESTGDNKLLLFSSHQMGYVEEICEEITLIDSGNIVLSGNLSDIQRELGENKLRLSAVNMNMEELTSYIGSQINGIDINNDKQSLIITLNLIDKSELLSELLKLNVDIDLFSVYKPSMSDIFIKYVGDEK